MKLRRKLQDLYDDANVLLAAAKQAFTDDEVNDLIDDAFVEVSDGKRTSTTPAADDVPLAMLVSRADGVLMLAQDESRRQKWEMNNKIVDGTEGAKRLIDVAKELRQRYKEHRDRTLKAQVEGVVERPIGGQMIMNATVAASSARDFNNRDVRRNMPRR